MNDKISQSLFDKFLIDPLKEWINSKLVNLGNWLIVNGMEVITITAIVIIITMGLKIFIQIILMRKDRDDMKTYGIIYLTTVIYSIIRLFWRVVWNV